MLVNWPEKPISRQFVDQITETETVQARIEKKGREVWGGEKGEDSTRVTSFLATTPSFLQHLSHIDFMHMYNLFA